MENFAFPTRTWNMDCLHFGGFSPSYVFKKAFFHCPTVCAQKDHLYKPLPNLTDYTGPNKANGTMWKERRKQNAPLAFNNSRCNLYFVQTLKYLKQVSKLIVYPCTEGKNRWFSKEHRIICHPFYSEVENENHKPHSKLFEIPDMTILSLPAHTNVRKNPLSLNSLVKGCYPALQQIHLHTLTNSERSPGRVLFAKNCF